MRKRNFFYSDQQYQRYLYAIKFGEKLKRILDQGYLLFDKNEQVIGDIVLDDSEWSVVAVKTGKCTASYVDLEYWDDGRPWICSKETILNTFKSFSYVHHNDIQKIV